MAALNTNPQRSNLNINFPTVNNDRFFANHPIITMIDHCSNANHLKQIHAQMLRTGLFLDPYSASKLIQTAALSQFSSIEYARKVFDQIPNPNIYSWNALIRAYSSSPEPMHSFLMFTRLYCEGSEPPNKFTYPFVIKALAKLAELQVGKGFHGMVIKSGFISDLYVLNSLIHFYVECGCLDMAYQVFSSMPKRDVVSWNSMINGFAQRDYADEALDLFNAMEGEDVKPNDVTMLGVLSACGKKLDLELGRWVHSYIVKNGSNLTLFLNNAILDMYTKCGSVEEAMRVFNEMEEKDVISWTTMLSGYARLGDFDVAKSLLAAMPCQSIAPWNALISAYEQNGKPKEALAIFNELQLSKKAKPDEVTLVSTLSACAQLGAMDLGGWIHVYIKKEGINLESHLITLLIDMYSKCGDLEKALDVFHSVDKRDVFAWSAMIGGLAMHGFGRDAIELFSKMKEAKIEPNSVTFTNLLSACSHSGLVEEGREFFRQMELDYNVVPGEKHYACMVDILGRAGHLMEAMEFIKNMPITPSASVWSAMLGTCGLHSNVDLAEHACARLLELEPENHGAYVSLSNIYALAGKWDKVTELRKVMKDCGLKKEPGCSSIEVDGVVHEFVVGDSSHPLSNKIYLKMEEMAGRLKSVGYVPNKSQLLQLVEEDTQEHALHLHSERLAIAFGLLTMNSSRPIRIMKNLRVCEDCHSVTKLISELYDREIIIRDRYRFHHFKGGSCSCNDYW